MPQRRPGLIALVSITFLAVSTAIRMMLLAMTPKGAGLGFALLLKAAAMGVFFDLVTLSYVFGEQLGQYSGRIKQTPELEEMAHEFGEFKVVVVEVCLECHWNHMILSYLLGDGVKRKPPRRQQTVEDIYG